MRALVALSALLLTGCASATAPHAASVVTTQAAPETVQVGAAPAVDFPVDARPRPIVVRGDLLTVIDGYRSGEEKAASWENGFEFVGRPPTTPEPAPVTLPDGPATLPFISASDALQAFAAPPRGKGQQNTPVRLVGVEFGTAEFDTDRGRWTLPAWRFTAESGTVVATPALGHDAFWRPAEVKPSATHTATVSGADLTVTMPAPPDACPGEEPVRFEPVVTESETSVVVSVREVGERPPGGVCMSRLALKTQPYQVELAKPLGNRLLVDGEGGVVVVTAR